MLRILNVQRMSTEDGPGLRTTVFFKGCPLRCRWCHNPESISFAFEKEWISIRCIHCHSCVDSCRMSALSEIDDEIITDPAKCVLCMECVTSCPGTAMLSIGKAIDITELTHELMKDQAYFGAGGGITLSGGEVLAQADEATLLCRQLKAKGVHIAIDTSGFAPYASIEKLLPYTDLFLYDLKLNDALKHLEFCGVDNQLIKDNLISLSRTGKTIWIRTPIIPGATDTVDNIQAIAGFLKTNAICFERWELAAFNNLCEDKYERLHQVWHYAKTPLVEDTSMKTLVDAAKSILGPESVVISTGLTRMEEQNT